MSKLGSKFQLRFVECGIKCYMKLGIGLDNEWVGHIIDGMQSGWWGETWFFK